MKKMIAFTAVLFLSGLAQAQIKGFVRPEVSLSVDQKITDTLWIIECLKFEVEAGGKRLCVQFPDQGNYAPYNKLTALKPGLYHIGTGSMYGTDLVEIKVSEVTKVDVRSITVKSVEKMIPALANYKDYEQREYIISPNYMDTSNRSRAERHTRLKLETKQIVGGCLTQNLSLVEIASKEKLWVCGEKKNYLMPVRVEDEAQGLIERYHSYSPAKGIYLNEYNAYGHIKEFELRLSGDKDGYVVTVRSESNSVARLVPWYTNEATEALLPGKYILSVKLSSSDETILDVFPLNL